MTAIYGLYATPDSAQRAFDKLRAAGISEKEIVVMSSEPLEEYAFGSRDRQTVMPWIAVLGAATGLGVAYLLTSVTQKAWAINTGGMPIVSNYTNLIIMFELTMLGAVFATVLTLMKTARLPGRLPKFYDPEISRGKILVGVRQIDQPRLPTVEAAFKSTGVETIRTIE
jgi:hypothetical protein